RMRPDGSFDFVIVGGGVAGVRAAIGLAPAGRVLVLTKAEPAESNTGYAQGGIAAAMADDDSPSLHEADTIRAGDGLGVVEGGRAGGVRYFDREGALQEIRAGATLLATGGAGQVFRETTNPAVATGDGIALAFHAGARVADLEFVQFHPTALNRPGAPRF